MVGCEMSHHLFAIPDLLVRRSIPTVDEAGSRDPALVICISTLVLSVVEKFVFVSDFNTCPEQIKPALSFVEWVEGLVLRIYIHVGCEMSHHFFVIPAKLVPAKAGSGNPVKNTIPARRDSTN